MKKIKVLQIGLSYKAGGIENFLMTYQKYIDENIIQLDFVNVFSNAKDESFYKQLAQKGDMYDLPDYRKHPIKFIKEFKKLNNAMKYDVLHYNMNSACYLLPLIAAKLSGIKTRISHSHNSASDKGFLKRILHNINKHFITLFANEYLACSQEAGNWFYSKKVLKGENFHLVNNAIDLEKYYYNEETRKIKRKELGIEDETIVIGNVARFKKQKNHTFLLDIFDELLRKRENMKLLLVGYGPLLDDIKDKACQLGINDKIVFLGQRTDVPDIYQAMDVFVLPSIYEGAPVVGIEAQARGIPCFFSDTITQEVNILKTTKYITLRKSADEWANEIIDCIGKKVSINAKEELIKKGFDIKKEAKRLEGMYISFVKKRKDM